jgi:hypothetical protein
MKTAKKRAPVRLPACALKLAVAIADPFHPSVAGVCLPTLPAIASFKNTTYVRGTCAIGTNGIGFVAVTPCLAWNTPTAYYTDATFTGLNAALLTDNNTLVTGVNRASSNSPFACNVYYAGSDTKLADARGRIVSVGLSTQYVGTLMNTSGLRYMYRSPLHQAANYDLATNTAATPTTLSTMRDCVIVANDGARTFSADFPVGVGETDYSLLAPYTTAGVAASSYTQSVYPYSQGSSQMINPASTNFFYDNVNAVNVGVPTMLHMFTGVAGSSVYFEIVQHFEVVGVVASMAYTPSDGAPEAMQQVLNAAGDVAQQQTSDAKGGSFWNTLYDNLGRGAERMVERAVPALLDRAAAAAGIP